MLHRMKLRASMFTKIKNGSKTIELRLFDEKRKLVQPGDFIEFTCWEDNDLRLTTRVTALHRFSSFEELYSAVPKEKLGYGADETPDPRFMDEFYSREEQERYGVVGIELYCTALQKFLDAQNSDSVGSDYQTALAEVGRASKVTCWMWYVFPQIQGLGWSGTTAYFSIKDLQEARDYYDHPVLGARLKEISEVLMKADTDDPMVVFGDPDAYKLRSCMTLFKHAAPEDDIFQRVLDKFCRGTEDDMTLEQLGL